jgi:two-component system, OmpR family, alkaline phosphatase synthesis response regulator PhoP
MQSQAQVLVVEDEAEVNELIGAYAQIAGFAYVAALNGWTALEQARSHTLVLVLLDVMLPDLDGFEVCRRLKSERSTRDVPVVILTALDHDDYRHRAFECGAAAYLTKPFDPDQLLRVIRGNARAGVNGQEQRAGSCRIATDG